MLDPDSIAIALRIGCPIYVAEEVMDTASREIEFQVEEGEEHEDEHREDLDSNEDDEDEPLF